VAEKNGLPRDQPYKDLMSLINFVLRKFFKSLAEDGFLAIEACPKTLLSYIYIYNPGF
jgi:replication fork protection complex subunit Tof1/Swi1